jgi:hypothetical protein
MNVWQTIGYAPTAAWCYFAVGLVLAWWLRPAARAGLKVMVAWPWAAIAHLVKAARGTYPSWGPPL